MKLTKLLPASCGLTLVVMASLLSCKGGHNTDGVALEGTLKADSIEEFAIMYNEEGDLSRARTIYLERDAEGHFSVPDSLLPANGTHVQILADSEGFFGAWLEPGKKARLEITKKPDGKFTTSFSGDNDDINTYFNDLTQTYDIMVFSPQDPSERKPFNESMAYLEDCRKRLEGQLSNIKDEEKRKYYAHYSDMMYSRMKGFIIEDMAYEQDMDPNDNPEYLKLINKVDPNDDAALETGMIFIWLNNEVRGMQGPEVEKAKAKLKVADEKITNKKIRKAVYNMTANNFFAYTKPTPEAAAEFMKIYGEMAKDFPEFIDHYTLVAQGVKEIKSGDPIAYDPTISTPDGKTCKLSDLYGELLYIDFWATWCGPCCRQIPHLEKLVEKMKDVKGIRFISISSDSDREAWLAKIRKDNPQWPQYIFDGNDGDSFMTAMNITGIPRFMIIGPDGKVIEPDAPMPSDSKTEELLRSLLK